LRNKNHGYSTDYYIDFGGAFGETKGAYVLVSVYSGGADVSESDEIKDMIENIYSAE